MISTDNFYDGIHSMILSLKDGNTPLHLAARDGQTAIVKYLIEQGADKSVKNKVRKFLKFHESLLTLPCSIGMRL